MTTAKRVAVYVRVSTGDQTVTVPTDRCRAAHTNGELLDLGVVGAARVFALGGTLALHHVLHLSVRGEP